MARACSKLRFGWVIVALALLLSAGDVWSATSGKKVGLKADQRNRERRADKYLKEIAVLKKRADKLTAAGKKDEAGALETFCKALDLYAKAELLEDREAQERALKKAAAIWDRPALCKQAKRTILGSVNFVFLYRQLAEVEVPQLGSIDLDT